MIIGGRSWITVGGTIAAIIAAIATVVSVVLVQCGSEPQRSLSLRLLSDVDVTQGLLNVPGSVKVLYDEKEIERMRVTEVSVRNDGDDDIPSDAFEVPLSFMFSDESLLLAAEVIDKDPAGLEPILSISGAKVTLEPLLLNKGDRFTIRLVGSASAEAQLNPHARVNGIRSDFQVKPISIDDDSGGGTGTLLRTTAISGALVTTTAILVTAIFSIVMRRLTRYTIRAVAIEGTGLEEAEEPGE